jgi:hypothetical protein
MIKIVTKIFNKCGAVFFKASKHLLFKIFAILFFIISSQAFSQAIRSTTFDDRPACEEVRGVWRQFGDGCIDQCSAKFDKFSICPQVLAYGCDCGRNRCWNGETCIIRKDYKKIFDEEQAQEKKILDLAKDERKLEAKANQQYILNNLAKKTGEITDQNFNQSQDNNSNNALAPKFPGQNQPLEKPIQPPKYNVKDPSQNPQQPVEPEESVDPSLIPPFFQQLEKAKRDAANAEKLKDAANAEKLKDAAKVPQNISNQDPAAPISTLHSFPIIPLPQ